MGIAFWVAGGAAAFLSARIIPSRRPPRWWPELLVALVTALLLGVVATALDFGGWAEPDWRAAAFAALGAFAAVGVLRIARNP